jgi:hypothetical protein
VLRRLEPELLDHLPPADPRAVRSRRDLRLINRFMGNARLLARLLSSLPEPPRSIVELGAGDGTLMLEVARRLAPQWRAPVRLQLLDMAPVVQPATLQAFARLDWSAEVLACDLRHWIGQQPACGLIVANLFLHHFEEPELREFFSSFSAIAPAFACCEPRRWRPALWTTRLLWALGCSRVTQHDAIVSVRAGFRERELSSLWPAASGFDLDESGGNLASHVFFALKRAR